MLLYAQDEIGYLSDAVISEWPRGSRSPSSMCATSSATTPCCTPSPAGKYHVQVCTNISCMLRGGNELLDHCKKRLGIGNKETTPDKLFSLEEVECIGACSWAPAVQVNYDFHENLTPDAMDKVLDRLPGQSERTSTRRTAWPTLVSHPDEVKLISYRFGKGATDIDKYIELDGYTSARKAIALGAEGIIAEMKASGLRGRGGAGFPTGMKWSFVPKQSPKPKYVLVNGDESEPGTCKDRLIFEHDPHSVIEGVIIAGLAIGSKMGFIYLRGEYRYLLKIMEKAIDDAYAKGFLGKNIFGSDVDFDIVSHTGAGAYEVGEESALMESLEGKRGIPRIRPPFPAVVGLYGGPTIINNAETLATVPHIFRIGARGVRQARHRTQWRHPPVLLEWQCGQARRLRTAHGLQPQEDDL